MIIAGKIVHQIIDLDMNTVRVVVTCKGADVWTIKRTVEAFARGDLGTERAW